MTSKPQLESIFTGALEIVAPEDRRAFLDRACGGDASLRREVEEMLAAHDDAGSFLERPAVNLDPTTLPPDAETANERGVPFHSGAAGAAVMKLLEPSESGALGRIGPYEVLEWIGSGGMGIVFKARDVKLDRIVALKVLAPAYAANPAACKRFQREARAAAAVNHPHVVTIHAVAESPHTSYLVMEFVDGPSLQQKLDRCGPLETCEILRIGMQIAQGLAAAHAQGRVHRDIKPANILLENGVERVKITDFGLARAVDDVGITRTGEVAGTPQYMSPEQALGRSVDQRSDLFSLGSVLYAMCTGRAPFRADSTVAVLRRVCDDAPRPIHEVNPDVPDELIAIVDRLLAKEPDERYQSAAEAAQDLETLLAGVQRSPAGRARAKRPAKPHGAREHGAGKPATKPQSAVVSGCAVAIGVIAAGCVLLLIAGIVVTVIYLSLDANSGTLVVDVDDPGVSVTIDGEEVVIPGIGAREIRLEPGTYRLTATKDGKPIKQQLITVTRNRKQVVRVSVEGSRSAHAQEFKQDFELVVRAGRGELTDEQKRRLLAENHPLSAQLNDPNTRPLIDLFARLSDEEHRRLLADGYLKWRFADLSAERAKVYQDALKLNLETAKESGFEPPAGMSLEALKKAEVGFAVVNVPVDGDSAQVVSWYILLPEHAQPIWVTVVGAKYAGTPAYFTAHNEQLPKLRLKPLSELPQRAATEPPQPAVAPFDAEQAGASQQAWARHLGAPVEYTNGLGMKFRLIPPGEFQMGNTVEEVASLKQELPQAGGSDFVQFALGSSAPRHRVRLSRAYYLGKHEVTVDDFRRFVEATGYTSTAGKDNPDATTWQELAVRSDDPSAPVWGVSWADAAAFCRWLSERESLAYSLPTEAQWEFACRGGSQGLWSFGDDPAELVDHAIVATLQERSPQTVGRKQSNAFGLFDMHGNVDEWCLDWHNASFYQRAPLSDPACLEDPADPASGRVVRGGAWNAAACWSRSATRTYDFPAASFRPHGFRVAIVGELPQRNAEPNPVAGGETDTESPAKLDARQIKALLAEAAGIPNDEWAKLSQDAKGPSPSAVTGTPLSLVLLTLDPSQAARTNEDAIKDFWYLTEGLPKPSDIGRAMARSQSQGYASFLQPEYVTDVSVEVADEVARGSVAFVMPKLCAGKVQYAARRTGNAWRIEEFRLPHYGITLHLDDDGVWQRSETPQPPADGDAAPPSPKRE